MHRLSLLSAYFESTVNNVLGHANFRKIAIFKIFAVIRNGENNAYPCKNNGKKRGLVALMAIFVENVESYLLYISCENRLASHTDKNMSSFFMFRSTEWSLYKCKTTPCSHYVANNISNAENTI